MEEATTTGWAVAVSAVATEGEVLVVADAVGLEIEEEVSIEAVADSEEEIVEGLVVVATDRPAAGSEEGRRERMGSATVEEDSAVEVEAAFGAYLFISILYLPRAFSP